MYLLRKYGKRAIIFLLIIFSLSAIYGNVQAAAGDVLINEVFVANGSTLMDASMRNFEDVIELYNTTGNSIDISGYYLSDDAAVAKWQIPSSTVIPAYGYVLFWADELNTGNHTNFKLKDGEQVALFNKNRLLIDVIDFGNQLPDISYGRVTNGGNTWGYFATHTIGSNNGAQTAILDRSLRAAKPKFVLDGGFYNNSVSVSFEPNTAEIRYTTDGSEPKANSTLYTAPFNVTSTTVIRAQAFASGKLPSARAARTYFIDESFTMPVISMALEEDYLWDDAVGIYVKGEFYTGDDWSGNYYQPWERPMTLEFYETDGSLAFDFNGGVSIHGNYSRQLFRKSLSIDTREQYGSDPVEYKIFDDRPRTVFEDFVLRSSGGDYNSTVFRDALAGSLLENHIDVDLQGYRPAILFVNGEYWGIHNIREKTNANTLSHYHNVDANNLDILREKSDVIMGDANDYKDLLDYIGSHDMAQTQHYEYIKTQIDIDEFMNYFLSNIYLTHSSWPKNNIKYWHEKNPDGKWRWIFFDTDSNFDLRNTGTYSNDKLAETLDPAETWGSFLLRNLMKNNEFRYEFAQRFAANLNITFDAERVQGMIDDIVANLEPEMPRHIDRWDADPWGLKSMNQWYQNIDIMRNFANLRVDYVFGHINSNLNLNGTTTLNIDINDITAGNVLIHDVPMLKQSLSGRFFRGVPIKLKAVAKTGYRFVEWRSNGTAVSTNPNYAVTINSTYNLTAVFAAIPTLVINEIHYNPLGDDTTTEFIELYNPNGSVFDLGGYHFTEGITLTFPSGSSIPAHGYALVAPAGHNFVSLGCPIYAWSAGALDNGGEQLEIRNTNNNVLDYVAYDDEFGWVTAPDGDGPSLSLIDPGLDNSLASSWKASSLAGGTPCQPNAAATHPLVINEIHYNPAEAQGSDEVYEYIELYNAGSTVIDLSNYRFTAGIEYTFATGTTIRPGQFILLAKLASTYSTVGCSVYQWSSGNLSNGGEALVLVDALGNPIDSVVYGDNNGWPTEPDGTGPSLALKQPASDNSLAVNWQASQNVGGTPCDKNDNGPLAVQLQQLQITAAAASGFILWVAFSGLATLTLLQLIYQRRRMVTLAKVAMRKDMK